jgi:predicted CoA-binding protein
MSEEYYVVSLNGDMVAMVEIKETESFDSNNFIKELLADGYKVQCVSKEQKDILLPKDISLN